MKKKYFEPEFDKLVITTQLMSNVAVSDPEYDSHTGNDDDDGPIT